MADLSFGQGGLPVNIVSETGNVAVVSSTGAVLTSSKDALTASAPTSYTAGTSSGAAISANSSRRGLVIMNTSSNTVSFGIGASAVLNNGITLTPGGVWVMDEYTFSTSAINAIASAASSNISIQEFV